eukprot:scaffold421_cov333-Pavlova_lutheri.AAC.3
MARVLPYGRDRCSLSLQSKKITRKQAHRQAWSPSDTLVLYTIHRTRSDVSHCQRLLMVQLHAGGRFQSLPFQFRWKSGITPRGIP